METDLTLTENSCRFCLGDGEAGTQIVSSRKSYFCVERRLVDCKEIFNFLELRIENNNLPNVPKNICHECKKTIVAFYGLRKNFLENEAVLRGKPPTTVENCVKNPLLTEIEEFLKENEHEKLILEKLSDKLVIQVVNHVKQKKLKHSLEDHIDAETSLHNKDELDMISIIQSDHESDDEESLAYENLNEEYLEDQTEQDPTDFILEEEVSVDTSEARYELLLKKGSKFFDCHLCDRKFASRSGRDTHTQLKHKAPPDMLSTSVDEHEIETDLEDGSVTKVWKCPICPLISKKKNHHQTHMIRHAIREKEDAFKQRIQQEGLEEAQMSTDKVEIPKPEIRRISLRVQKNLSSHFVAHDDHFSCSKCKAKFTDAETAKKHVQKYARTGMCADCLCSDCSVVFSTEKNFKRHIDFHSVSAIAASLAFPMCLVCRITFGSVNDLDFHLATSHLCETDRTTQLEGAEYLVYNLQPENNSEDYHCAYCIKAGPKDDVNLHMALFHGHLVCPFDLLEFARSSGYFMDHLKTKHPEKFTDADLIFKCPHCDLEFRSKAAKTEHSGKCEAKTIHCNHCDRRFAFDRQLKKHLALVKGEKSHKCVFCEKSFINRNEMNVHIRSHTNERPYICSFPGCNKNFRTNSHRSAHMDIHNPAKNFKCTECNEIFQTRTLRRLHEKSHVTGVIGCELCQKEFGQRSHYVRHVNRVHHIQCTSLNLEETIRQFNNKTETA